MKSPLFKSTSGELKNMQDFSEKALQHFFKGM